MKKSCITRGALVLLLLIFPLGFAAAETQLLDPFVLPSPRSAGMGGSHAALADDFSTIFSNPAGLQSASGFSILELGVSLYGPLNKLIPMLVDGSLDTGDIPGLVGALAPDGKLAVGADIGGPIALGYVGNGFGLGLFNRTRVDARLTKVSGLPALQPAVSEEVILLAGLSYRVLDTSSLTLDVGAMGKGFVRASFNKKIGLADLVGTGLDGLTGMFDDFMTIPMDTQFGFGVDLGARLALSKLLSVGLVYYDVYSPAWINSGVTLNALTSDPFGNLTSGGSLGDGRVKSRLDLGVALDTGALLIFDNIRVMADYHDLLELIAPGTDTITRNPVLNVGIGVEVGLFNILDIRAGISDGIPSLGLGLNLFFCQLNLAIHGKEFGLEPGVESTMAAEIGLAFRF